ncbi:hypothetical protein BH23ACT9_BH23ACT9_12800 [soil metagenome]
MSGGGAHAWIGWWCAQALDGTASLDPRPRTPHPWWPPLSDSPTPTAVRIPLSGTQAVAEVGGLVWPGVDPDAPAVILAHGAGTDMQHAHMQRHARDLAVAGHPTALFNFAYTEMGRRRPDPAARLHSAWCDAIAVLRPLLGAERALVIGGRSMGGRIASMVAAADGAALGLAGIACLAYPLHPPGRPEKLRIGHWPLLAVPVLLVSGSRDAMAPLPALHATLADHMPSGIATLHVVRGADHSFHVRRADGRTGQEVLDEVGAATTDWLSALA